jgi:hypothetical protein
MPAPGAMSWQLCEIQLARTMALSAAIEACIL